MVERAMVGRLFLLEGQLVAEMEAPKAFSAACKALMG